METLGDFVAFLFLAAVLYAFDRVGRETLDEVETRVTRDWPLIDAVIVGYKLRDISSEDYPKGSVWGARLQYSYMVRGTSYLGSMKLKPLNMNRTAAEEFARSLVNKKILICYKPDRPGKSLYRDPVNAETEHVTREDGLFRRAFWLCFR